MRKSSALAGSEDQSETSPSKILIIPAAFSASPPFLSVAQFKNQDCERTNIVRGDRKQLFVLGKTQDLWLTSILPLL
jgi:hypothetical protein